MGGVSIVSLVSLGRLDADCCAASVQEYDVVEAAEQRRQGHAAIKRFKALRPKKTEPVQAHLSNWVSSSSWTENPLEGIGEENVNKVLRFLREWIEELETGIVVRPPRCALQPVLCDYSEDVNVPLSVIVYNLMVTRYGRNREDRFVEVKKELHTDLVKAAEAIAIFYLPKHPRDSGTLVCKPDDQPGSTASRLRAAGDLLHYLAHQSDELGVFEGTPFPHQAITHMIADFQAYQKQQPVPSYVGTKTRLQLPNHIDEGGVFEHDDASLASGELGFVPLYDYKRPSRFNVAIGQTASRDGADAQPKCPPAHREERDAEDDTSGLHARAQQAPTPMKGKTASRTSPVAIYTPETYEHKSLGRADLENRKKRRPFSSLWGSAERTKRKAWEDGARPKPKRQRIADSPPTRGPSVASQPALGEESGWVFKPLPTSGVPRPPRTLVLPDDDPGEPKLKISAAKHDELQLAHQRRLQDAEAARKKEAEEQRRREQDRLHKEEAERILRSGGFRQPRRRVIAPISDEWQSRVARTLSTDDNTELAKSPEGTGLTARDFKKVVDKKEWLNDEIVNSSLMHLAKRINSMAGIHDTKKQTPRCHAFNSFFWKRLVDLGPGSMLRGMKRSGITQGNFLDIDTVLIPICKSNHWTLVVVQPSRRIVAYMDSMGPQGVGGSSVVEVVLKWVREVLGEKWADDWRVMRYRSTCQINGHDCGVHVVTNAIFVAMGLDPSGYDAREMKLQRDRLAATLLNGGFTGDFDLGGL